MRPTDPSGAAREGVGGGQPVLQGASRLGWLGKPSPWGWGQVPDTSLLAIFLTGSLPKEESSLLQCSLGNYSKEVSLPWTPKSPVLALCVCTHVCVGELWVQLSVWEPCVCLTLRGSEGPLCTNMGAVGACTGCVPGCVPVRAPCLLFQRKSEAILHLGPALCPASPSRASPA